MACKGDRQLGEELFDGPSHVRFWLLVDGDGGPLSPGEVNAGLLPVETYTHEKLSELAIPVAMSLGQGASVTEVTVDIAATVAGTFAGFSLSPASGQLTLSRTEPVDTVYLRFEERWPADSGATIELALTAVSSPEVQLGSPTAEANGRTLSITLGELDPTYQLSENRIELSGNQGETHDFAVHFPAGYLPGELPDSLFRIESAFGLAVAATAYEPEAIRYTLTLTEALTQDALSYEARLRLAEVPGYTLVGSEAVSVVRPPLVDRDNSVQTAAAFYDLSDPFYRTYGTNWFDFNADTVCDWQDFFAFTYPVEVPADHPQAVLYDDLGTPDTTDDIYHHAFRIGFNSPNAGNTTNSFGLKRWFNNESTSSANSPGFNIPEALEFYPEGGDNPDQGVVLVIPQDLVVASTSGNSYVIAIEGEGTYARLPGGYFELAFELRATNEILFGGTRADQYRLYNYSLFPDPAPLASG
ncbi:MAG: hypothetical protein D6722_21055, partial [Bacteroidetes bacterium]